MFDLTCLLLRFYYSVSIIEYTYLRKYASCVIIKQEISFDDLFLLNIMDRGADIVIDKIKTVCFSGHRIISEPKEELKNCLRSAITDCIKDGMTNFIAGGALGFDTLAEQVVIELKHKYPQITLTLALPCPPEEQTARWSESQRIVYNEILNKADETVIISPHYINGCMQKRNRFMVDNSTKLICYLRQNRGGTFYTVNYALKNDKIIIRL